MRIVSLLPSLTELVCALGGQSDLVGITHECDYPPGIESLPHLTRSRIPSGLTSDEIDRLVKEKQGSLYDLDEGLLAELKPSLILTQEQCDVCAINESTVRRAAGKLPGSPFVESVNPLDLRGVFQVFRRVGELIGAPAEADRLIADFHSVAEEIARRIGHSSGPPPRVLLLEWLDPPFSSGHWNPEIVSLAGGLEVLGNAGQRSIQVSWDALRASAPSLVLVSICGYTLEQAEREIHAYRDRTEWRSLMGGGKTDVVLVDGSAFFSRPGPRLLTSLQIAAAAIFPDACRDLAPGEGSGWKRYNR